MKKKQVIFLVIAVVVIGVIALVTYKKRTSVWSEAGQISEKLFANFPLDDVAAITIKTAKAEVNLVKKDDIWRVKERDDFPANFNEISEFLRKMWEMKRGLPIEVGESKLGVLELLPPGKGTNSGTLVEFKDKNNKVIATLLLGKKSMKKSPAGGEWPDGRYVMVNNDIKTVSQLTEIFSNIEPKPENWIDKEFFKVEKPKSFELISTNAADSWKIYRESETNEWKMADLKGDEKADTIKITAVGTSLSYPTFVDVVSSTNKLEDMGLDKPVKVIVETFDGFTYTLKIGKKTADDNYYLAFNVNANFPKERQAKPDEKPEEKEKLNKEFQDNLKKLKEKYEKEKKLEKWNYLVTKWTIETILKTRKELLQEKKEEPKPASVTTTNAPSSNTQTNAPQKK
jgi:hypothetical protein